MGSGVSSGLAAAVKVASADDVKGVLQGLSKENREKILSAMGGLDGGKGPVPAAGAGPVDVPKETVMAGMKGFEDLYNAGKFEDCGKCYAPECEVAVNGGAEAGGFGPFKTQEEVAGFLKTLSGTFGGTNMAFTVTSVNGNTHCDTWVADNGTGACKAVWEQVDGNWMITKDEITFAPGVPKETVNTGMKGFEDLYNAGKFEDCGKCYAPECEVAVNGGAEAGGFGPFKTQEEVAGFLKTLSGEFGGTNMAFTVTKVEGMVHEDTWTADSGTGACKATWARIGGNWMITKDEISFTPKAA